VRAVDDLERSYRRWLRWYPHSFRAEHEEEMLAVLVSTAPPGRRHPEPMERVNLLLSAASVWTRPRIARSDRAMHLALRFMWLGAGVELAVSLMVWATSGNIRSAILTKDPHYSSAQWHAETTGRLEPLAIVAGAFVLIWLWLAWANGRGHRWAKIAFALLFIETTFSLLHGLDQGSATYARQDLIAGILLWVIELSAVIALIHSELGRFAVARTRTLALPARPTVPTEELF
jgi:hypothetical protein